MNLFPDSMQQHLVLVLAHFVWQGLLLAVLTAGLLAGLRKSQPTLRYGVMLIVFGLLTVSPVATWCLLSETTADSLTSDTTGTATELVASDPPRAGLAADQRTRLEPAGETTRHIPSGLPDDVADTGPEFKSLLSDSAEGTLSQTPLGERPRENYRHRACPGGLAAFALLDAQ